MADRENSLIRFIVKMSEILSIWLTWTKVVRAPENDDLILPNFGQA